MVQLNHVQRKMLETRRARRVMMLDYFGHRLLDRIRGKKTIRLSRQDALLMSTGLSEASRYIQRLETALRLKAPEALDTIAEELSRG